MRVCIIGAGAIGGFTGARLALGGHDVTFLARGRNLEILRSDGIRLRHADGREDHVTTVRATDSWEPREKYDAVLVALKAYQLVDVAARIEGLCGEDTVVVPMQNGIPFWYFNGHGGPLAGRVIESVDPGGRIRDAIPARRIIGSVVYVASQHVGPGRVAHVANDRFMLGEPGGGQSARLQALAQAFIAAGMKGEPVEDIRSEAWVKVWGNVSFNPISALTRATLVDICLDKNGRELAIEMMREAQEVAGKLGITFRMSIEKRIEAAQRVGAHKTSMLQDLEAGRALEVDALVGSVIELGKLVGVETPAITAVYRAVKLLDAARSVIPA